MTSAILSQIEAEQGRAKAALDRGKDLLDAIFGEEGQ